MSLSPSKTKARELDRKISKLSAEAIQREAVVEGITTQGKLVKVDHAPKWMYVFINVIFVKLKTKMGLCPFRGNLSAL